jgi:hypothetical protein
MAPALPPVSHAKLIRSRTASRWEPLTARTRRRSSPRWYAVNATVMGDRPREATRHSIIEAPQSPISFSNQLFRARLSLASQSRVGSAGTALNFVATNAIAVNEIFQVAIRDGMELDAIDVVRSPNASVVGLLGR